MKITTRIDKPGFVRIIVNVLDHNGNPKTGRTERFESGAGADVNLLPADPLPADFHAFWDKEVARLHKTPFDTEVVELPHRDVKVLKFPSAPSRANARRPGTSCIPGTPHRRHCR